MEIMKGDNMLVINVIFKIKNGSREDFLKIVREEGIDVASRNEEGNYRYDFFFSMEDPEDIFLLEFWKDQDAHSYKEEFGVEADVRKYFTDEEA